MNETIEIKVACHDKHKFYSKSCEGCRIIRFPVNPKRDAQIKDGLSCLKLVVISVLFIMLIKWIG